METSIGPAAGSLETIEGILCASSVALTGGGISSEAKLEGAFVPETEACSPRSLISEEWLEVEVDSWAVSFSSAGMTDTTGGGKVLVEATGPSTTGAVGGLLLVAPPSLSSLSFFELY